MQVNNLIGSNFASTPFNCTFEKNQNQKNVKEELQKRSTNRIK